MSSMQFKHLTKNSALFTAKRKDQWGVVLFSFCRTMAFCNPLEQRVFLASTQFKTTKVHQAGWLEAIVNSGSIPDVRSFPSIPASEEQIEALFDEFLRLPQ